MIRRIISSMLVVLLLFGLGSAYMAESGNARLRADYARMYQVGGDLDAPDPTKVYIQTLPGEDPLDFRWRVHVPAKYSFHLTGPGGGQQTNQSPSDFVVRFRLKQDVAGAITCYFTRDGLGTFMDHTGYRQDPELGAWLVAHLNDLEIRQVGKQGVETFDATDHIELLTIHVPEEVGKTASENVKKAYFARNSWPDLFKVALHSTVPKPANNKPGASQ